VELLSGNAPPRSRGYYAGQGNEFWGTLYEVGLITEPLGPHLSHRVLEFGIGLTDLAKDVAASSDRGLASAYDIEGFVAKMRTYVPAWVAFHGKEAAKAVSRVLGGVDDVRYGIQQRCVAASRVFVVPSMSGSNRNPSRLEGKPTEKRGLPSWPDS
jgi:double-stranded uracil-DNA glycosylase